MDIHKSVKITIERVKKNPETLNSFLITLTLFRMGRQWEGAKKVPLPVFPL